MHHDDWSREPRRSGGARRRLAVTDESGDVTGSFCDIGSLTRRAAAPEIWVYRITTTTVRTKNLDDQVERRRLRLGVVDREPERLVPHLSQRDDVAREDRASDPLRSNEPRWPTMGERAWTVCLVPRTGASDVDLTLVVCVSPPPTSSVTSGSELCTSPARQLT